MAPSLNLRSNLGYLRTPRRAVAAKVLTLVLGSALALTACGSESPRAAAVVDGRTISDKDVQTASLQLNTLAQGQQKLTPRIVLLNLILAPYVLAEAARGGKSVTDAQARKVIAAVPDPSRPTMDFVRMQLEIQSLTDASKTSILTKFAKAKITVNPRYGTFDAKQFSVVPTSPNWIKPIASSGVR